MAIKVLPQRKKKAPAMSPELRAQRQGIKFGRAQAQGQGDEWLASHQKIANKMGRAPSTAGMSDSRLKGVVDNSLKGDKAQAGMAAGMINPTTSTPFGGTSLTYDANGNPIYTQTESDAQKKIREQGEGLTQGGLAAAQGIVSGYKPLDWQGSPEERARIEQQVYDRLTRNTSRDEARDFDAMEQRMYNRGIPLDPTNPAYQRELNAQNEKYANIRENAAAQATILGGNEMKNSFGIAQQTQAQNMSDVGTLSGAGIGYQAGNLPGYQAPNVPGVATGDIAVNLLGQDTQKQIAQGMGGGGEEEDSPLA